MNPAGHTGLYTSPCFPQGAILLDTGASTSIIRDQELLTDVVAREPPLTSLTNGGLHSCDYGGVYHGLQQPLSVWYVPDSVGNILALCDVRRLCRITMDTATQAAFLVHLPDDTVLSFVEHTNGLYLLSPSTNHCTRVPTPSYSCVTTVADNRGAFTRRELEGADQAQHLYPTIGRLSQRKFETILDHGSILNCPVTKADAQRANIINGPDLAYLKGKTTEHPASPHVAMQVPSPLPADIAKHHSNVTLCLDFFYVQCLPFVHAISRKIGYRQAVSVLDRTKKTMLSFVNKSISEYTKHGFEVVDIHVDKEFECLRESLETLPETTRITFLQRAVQQNHDLRQIHVMDSVWRFKTDSTDTLTFETYYNLLWDAAHQYDLHHTKKGPQRKAFLSQHEEVNDEDEYIIEAEQFFNDPDPEEESSPYSVYQSSFHPKMPQKSYLPPKIWETLPESTKQMIIEHNKKVKLNNPTSYTSGSKAKPNPTMGKPNPAPQQVHQHSQDDAKEEPPPDTSAQTLVNKCLAESGIDPTDIQNVMSVSHAKRNISSHDSSRKIHTHQRYVFTRVNQSNHHLIDRGANGGLAGADMRVIHTTPRKINIVGIDDHELTGLNVVTAAALLDTQKGPIIGIFHEYAHLGKGKSIHASGQMEWFNCQVDDRSKIVGGAQRVETPEGCVIPLSIETGLVYMHPIRIPTDQDLQMYPHVFFTSPDIWDPSVLDHEITPSLLEDINQHSDDSLLQESIFDEYGDLHHRAIQTLNIFCDLPSLPPGEPTTYAHLHDSNPVEEDWESLRLYFGWQSEQVIKDTYKVTSRFGGTIPRHDYLKKHFKSRNPVFNIPDEMSLLPLTPFSVTHQPSMMVVPWPNSLLEETPWYVMLMASKAKNNLSTPSMTISDSGEPRPPSSLMVADMKSPRRLLTSSETFSSNNMNLNHITSIRIKLNNDMVLSSGTSTPS